MDSDETNLQESSHSKLIFTKHFINIVGINYSVVFITMYNGLVRTNANLVFITQPFSDTQ